VLLVGDGDKAGLEVSFDNVYYLRETWERTGDANSSKAKLMQQAMRASVETLTGATLENCDAFALDKPGQNMACISIYTDCV
jgi:hypothetical protein